MMKKDIRICYLLLRRSLKRYRLSLPEKVKKRKLAKSAKGKELPVSSEVLPAILPEAIFTLWWLRETKSETRFLILSQVLIMRTAPVPAVVAVMPIPLIRKVLGT